MRHSRFLDRCFATGLVLALVGFFVAVAFALADGTPRTPQTTLILQSLRR